MKRLYRGVLVAVLAVSIISAGLSVVAHAQIAPCTPITPDTLNAAPNALGIELTQPGTYCLQANLVQNFSRYHGRFFTVKADNVTLDLNGYDLRNFYFGRVQPNFGATAVYVDGYNNFTLKNGTIEGFFYGTQFYNADGTQIRSIRYLDNQFGISGGGSDTIRFENNTFEKISTDSHAGVSGIGVAEVPYGFIGGNVFKKVVGGFNISHSPWNLPSPYAEIARNTACGVQYPFSERGTRPTPFWVINNNWNATAC